MAGIVKIRNIKRLLSLTPNQPIRYVISGRIINYREYKSFNFVDLIDGSTNRHLQVIIKRDKLDKPELGSYITCQGSLVSSRGSKQDVEFKVDKLEYLGECNPLKYPLASTGINYSDAWFRKLPHLRPRAANFASLLRVRSELELSLHMIMKQMDFFRVHTPSLTSNDSEASGDLFVAKRTKLYANTEQDSASIENSGDSDNEDLNECSSYDEDVGETKRVIRDGYFKRDVFLVTSAQLHLENLAASLSRVYTMSNAFRAEDSITTRHLCEFLMFEAEEANQSEVEPIMDRVESIIKFVSQYLYNVSEHRDDFTCLMEANSNVDVYEKLALSPFIRMSYKEAMSLLTKQQDFTRSTEYGADIGRVHERKLLELCDNVPIFITNYPKRLKPFYMKCDESDTEALCFDLIAPHGGEICGGSLREDCNDKLIANLRRLNLINSDMNANNDGDHLRHFDWYLDLRRFGSFPHGGFGMGIERLLQSLLGIRNIRDSLAFPRWTGHCPM